MAEKRISKRKIKLLPVIYSSHGLEFKGMACNLSYSGIFIRTRKPFKPGVPVEVFLKVGDDCRIRVRGRSVRAINFGFVCRQNGMGVQLDPESEEYSNYLKDLLIRTGVVLQ